MLTAYTLSEAWGDDENEFSLKVGIRDAPMPGQYVMAYGTELGGRVRSVEPADSRGGGRLAVCDGLTWHGMLAKKVLMPPEGKDRPSWSGDAGDGLSWLIAQAGLGSVMRSEPCGTVVSHSFARFEDVYSAMRGMLRGCGMRLSLSASDSGIVARAVAAANVSGGGALKVVPRLSSGCVNHLVCAGEGQNQERAVVHLYADPQGRVSGVQTLFGADEVAELYDYSSADVETLVEKGTERLLKMQDFGSVDVEARENAGLSVGDIVTGRDEWMGIEVTAEVAKKIVKADGGSVSESYEAR